MIRILSLLLLLCFICPLSYAQDKEPIPISVPKGQFDDLKHTGSARVDKIIDGLTILMKDKTILRLSSLDIPDFHIWDFARYSEAAQKLLEEKLPSGTEVMIYQTRMAKKGRLNRMKHELGHIVTKKDEVWIQGMLLSHGLARVYTAPNAPEMTIQMLTAEQKARAEKRGMWEEESEFKILSPDNADQAMGELAVIEGIVQKTATVKNNIYLNFGKDWKTDFTIMISPTMRKKLARNGVNPLDMAHKPVRVRGFLREYNGPLIELEAAEHLEYPLPNAPHKDTPLQHDGEKPNLAATP